MTNTITRLAPVALTAFLALPLAGCQTDKGATWPAFGTYRLPYFNGTDVYVWHDFTSHDPLGRYDLQGQDGEPYSYLAVAAADGWVRYIVDSNSGHGTGNNNYVWIEHPYPYCQPAGVTWPNKPADYDQTCIPCSGTRCNEWTKYSHMANGSSTGLAGLFEGQWIAAGTFIGLEDDIGISSGIDHVHWEVTKVDPALPFGNDPESIANGWARDWSNDGWVGSPNVLPTICGIGILDDGDTHTAAPCPVASKSPPIPVSLLWQSGPNQTVPATASVVVDGPDPKGRLTLAALQLTAPAMFSYGDRQVTVHSLRLVRPVTMTLNHDGIGRLPADQLIWLASLDVVGPDGSRTRMRPSGPVRGTVEVAAHGARVQLSLDAGALGRITGTGVRR